MSEEIKKLTGEIKAYDPQRKTLVEIQKENSTLVFDYESPKGNKEARSHVHKLRRSKTAVEEVRKAEKAEALEYGRKVDSEAKAIIGIIEEMIDHHMIPIKAVEEKEAARVAHIQSLIEEIEECASTSDSGFGPYSSVEFKSHLEILESKEITEDVYGEYTEEAIRAKEHAIEKLNDLIPAALQKEADAAELAELRRLRELDEKREREEREAADRKAKEELIAKEAEERGRKAAEEQANREREEREAAERAEAERTEKLAANRKHQAKINNAAVASLMESEMSESDAKHIVSRIAKGQIAHVSINYGSTL